MSLDHDYEVAKAREDSMTAAFDALISKTLIMSNARVKAKELDRTAETYDQIYTNLLQRYIDAVNQQSYPQPSAHVITPATVPEAPSAPRGSLILLLGLFVGTGFGVSGAFARHWFDRTIRSPRQLTGHGLTCLAALPELRREPGFRAALALAQAHASEAQRPANVEAFKASAVRFMPQSVFVERLHSLKAHVLGSDRRGAVFAIGVTSVGSGAGKTLFASNFGPAPRPRPVERRAGAGDRRGRQACDALADQPGHGPARPARCARRPLLRHGGGPAPARGSPPARLREPPPERPPFQRPDDPGGRRVGRRGRAHHPRPRRRRSAAGGRIAHASAAPRQPRRLIIVVEAGRTSIDEVAAAVHDLESSGSTVLGIVLNKTSDGTTVRRGGLRSALRRWATAPRRPHDATQAAL